ncbi:ABC transporter ATP-binding protein [Aspergillus clavatus NRRL 1]|uniref:ABC multidrug transporter MDR2 n=1 Tax=Aspergillus clavatus (strain ATCC 1007 / CBS 513.65 / DSM 816 / NCTC 3887 / NRRL 1 / QM 1276 / 107) TaxID=344612 RepID=A1C4E7_ASPCL|nr:ABC multidrug transporter, putative [Aspergillus clavatus NRRL 1]EAW15287.1 ABC multidrug transporter, putative [Aspergillus clavatus NRRL 1]
MDSSPSAPPQEVKTPADGQQTVNKEDVEPKNSALKSYVRILSYGSRNGGILAMILGLVCAIGSGVALPLMNVVFGNLAGEFNRYFIPGTKLDEHAFKANVNKNSLYIVYLFIGKFVLTYISMICFRIISLRASAALRLEYIQALFAQPVSKLDETSVGTVTNAITSLSNTIQQSVSDRLAILFQSLALLVAAYAIAFRYSWALTLAVSSAILFVVIAYSFTVPILVKGQQMADRADEKHAAIAAEAFGSIRTVLSLGAEVPLTKKYMFWVDEARRRATRLCPVTGLHLCLIFFAMYCSYALAFWFGLKLYREGHIGNVNTVIIVFFSVLLVVTVLGGIASPLMAIIKATSASGPFFDMIQSERVTTDGLKSPAVSSESDIVFDSVTFAYPTRAQTQVLKNFNARFHSGKTTALVGPSGSGKSTIVALLERWYQLEAPAGEETTEKQESPGSILVDGHPINELDLKWWRTQIGLVEQEPVLFNESIYKNVAAGLIGTEWENESEAAKMELVVKACREAFADEFIDRLPLGYLTIVGEGGIMLSGGQRQRIAIARSIVRRPAILILDEATSSIDVRGEQIVQAALDRVSKNRTTIMIAHRLSTVRKADQIIVVQDGTNIEQGSPQELIDRGGFYYSLVHAQQLQVAPELEPAVKSEEEISRFQQIEPVKSALSETASNEGSAAEGSVRSAKKRGAFRTLWQLLCEQRGYWPSYTLTLAGAMGAGSAFALQSWLFAKLVQVFQFTGQKLVDAANFWSLMFFILAIAMAIFYFDLGIISTLISVKFASTYRKDYFESIIQKPITYFDREENASGTLMSRLSTDPKQLQELFGIGGIFPIISIFSLIGCIAISFSFGWKLAAVTFFAALPFILVAAYLRIRYEIQFEGMNAEVYADSSKFATEAIQAFRTVSALTMEDAIVQRYEDLLLQQRSKAMSKAWYATLIFAFSDSIDLCAMALTFWYGGQLLATREYDPVAFFVVYIAIVQGGQSAGQFFSFGPNIAQTIASVRRILDTRSTAVKVDQMAQPTSNQALSSQADINFRNVTFHYPSRDLPIFQHLNVSIQSGQFVAFVGPSGCGKSTLISLLERFYEPTHGTVEVGGQDIRAVDCTSYRRFLSLVAQEPRLFEGTIRENLLLGLAGDDPAADEEQMINACKQAEIHDFITSLADGYATELGINAQASLSGGQKQRLCIARALIRRPRLLLLDEATSSLDSTSERLIQEAMEKLAGKKSMTIIAVAHRLATIQKADVIFVFGEGERGAGSRIVEQGTHPELLQRRGVYWQMCQAQALDQ